MKKSLADLEKKLAVYFIDRAPSLPKSVKNFLVSAMPVLMVIDIVLLVFALISIVSIGFRTPWMMMAAAYSPRMGFSLLISGTFTVISLIFIFMAYSPISKRKYRGWQLLYYLTIIYLVEQLIVLNLLSFIVGGILSFYTLFQIREYYE